MFTYDPTLATDLDWVRFLTGDRVQATAVLQNEEITAILATEPNKWFAAAECGQFILARGKAGVVSKSVDGLSVSYDSSPDGAYGRWLQHLRERGSYEMLPRPRLFRVF